MSDQEQCSTNGDAPQVIDLAWWEGVGVDVMEALAMRDWAILVERAPAIAGALRVSRTRRQRRPRQPKGAPAETRFAAAPNYQPTQADVALMTGDVPRNVHARLLALDPTMDVTCPLCHAPDLGKCDCGIEEVTKAVAERDAAREAGVG